MIHDCILPIKAFLFRWINWLNILSARKGCHLRLFHWMTLCILIRQNFSHQKAHTDIFYQLQYFNAGNDLSQEIILVFFWIFEYFFFPRGNYQPIVPRQKHICTLIIFFLKLSSFFNSRNRKCPHSSLFRNMIIHLILNVHSKLRRKEETLQLNCKPHQATLMADSVQWLSQSDYRICISI